MIAITVQGFVTDEVKPGQLPCRGPCYAKTMAHAKTFAETVCSRKHLIEIYWERSDAGILRLAKWNPKSQQWLDFARNIAIALQESEDVCHS